MHLLRVLLKSRSALSFFLQQLKKAGSVFPLAPASEFRDKNTTDRGFSESRSDTFSEKQHTNLSGLKGRIQVRLNKKPVSYPHRQIQDQAGDRTQVSSPGEQGQREVRSRQGQTRANRKVWDALSKKRATIGQRVIETLLGCVSKNPALRDGTYVQTDGDGETETDLS